MILSAAGAQPVTVPGKNLLVTATLSLPDKDMGGFGSFTDAIGGGSEPKKLSCAMQVPFTDLARLQAFIVTAEAMDEAGDRVVYDIVDQTARAFNIRQVAFTGSVSAKERDNLQAWDVSFTLVERRSVAEMVEERLESHQVTGKTSDGAPLAGQGATDFAKVLDATRGI